MDHTSIPKMREAVSAPDNHHSTLGVVIGAPDYGKEVVQPSYDPPYAYIPDDEQHHAIQTPVLKADPVWSLDVGADTNPADERRILGLKRRTFFITAWVVSLLVAIAIGIGAGLGATMRSRNAELQGEASKSDVTALSRTPVTATGSSTAGASKQSNRDHNSSSSPHQVPTNPPIRTSKLSITTLAIESTTTRKIETSPPPSPTNTRPSTTSSPPPKSTSSSKPSYIGGVGGRCSNKWGGDCICVDQGICVNKWKGTPYTGFEGNWPCANDPEGIMTCIVKPYLGKTQPAQCLWREACSDVLDSGEFEFEYVLDFTFSTRCLND